MSKPNEIAEMARSMCAYFENGKCTASPKLFPRATCDINCEYGGYAEKLYEAGYRKKERNKTHGKKIQL